MSRFARPMPQAGAFRLLARCLALALPILVAVPPAARAQTDGVSLVAGTPHAGEVTAIAVSPDGRLIATAGHDRAIKLWHARTGRLLRTITAAHDLTGVRRRPRIAIEFARDGRSLLSAGGGGTEGSLRTWDPASGARLASQSPYGENDGDAVEAAIRAPDGAGIATCRYDEIALWSTSRALWRHKLELGSDCRLDLAAAGRLLVATFPDRLQARELADGRLVWARASPMASGQPSPDHQAAASRLLATKSGLVAAWAANGELRLELLAAADGAVVDAAPGPDCMLPRAVSRTGQVVLQRIKPRHEEKGPCKDGRVEVSLVALSAGAITAVPIAIETEPTAFAFSDDGRTLVTARKLGDDDEGSQPGIIEIWDTGTGARLQRIAPRASPVEIVELSADGSRLLASRGGSAQVWSTRTGRLERALELGGPAVYARFGGPGSEIVAGVAAPAVTWHPDTDHAGRVSALLGARPVFADAATGATRGAAPCGDEWTIHTGEAGGRRWVATVCASERQLRIRTADGAILHRVAIDFARLAEHGEASRDLRAWILGRQIAVSPDLAMVAYLQGGALTLQRLADGRVLRRVSAPNRPLLAVAFSSDARRLAYADESRVSVTAVADGRVLASQPSSEGVRIAFSPGDRYLVVSRYRGVNIYDTRTWKEVASGGWASGTGASWRYFDGDQLVLRSVFIRRGATAQRLASSPADAAANLYEETIDGAAKTAFHKPSGRMAFATDRLIRIVDVRSGKVLGDLAGQSADVTTLAISAQGDRVAAGGADGTVRLWSLDREGRGRLLATMLAEAGGQWQSITSAGFFVGAGEVGDTLNVVRGTDVTMLEQLHQSLYNPDLVAETVTGDPDGEAAAAARVADLDKVLESGPAPTVELSVAAPPLAGSDVVTAEARVTDAGRGVGRVEWRVNGITSGVATVTGSGPVHVLARELALEPGSNRIEVVAYNRDNLLASLAARRDIERPAAADASGRPVLHILAIGIDGYTDRGWIPPGKSEPERFGPLGLAVADAKVFAEAMRAAAGDLYADVRVTLALDGDATRARLQETIDRLAPGIAPRDTFVLFAAAHGTSHAGRFHLLTHDHDGGSAPEALARHAVGQDMLQDWLANRIRAKRALLLLDTCEAGALVAGHTRSRLDQTASEASLGRLHEATGRPVLTAAAAGQFAHEGVIADTGARHGLFTWAVLDALANGDRNGNGRIELQELVAHVQQLVPTLAQRLGGVARAAAAGPAPVFGKQSARFGSRGEDFTLVGRRGR